MQIEDFVQNYCNLYKIVLNQVLDIQYNFKTLCDVHVGMAFLDDLRVRLNSFIRIQTCTLKLNEQVYSHDYHQRSIHLIRKPCRHIKALTFI